MKSRVACCRVAILATVAVLSFGPAFAAGPWYVAKEDPNASDALIAGRGSEALPFRTIQAALDNEAFDAGDTVYVKRGDYDEGEYPITSKSTPATNRVLITKKVYLKALDGNKVTRIVGRWGVNPSSTSGAGTTDAIRCVVVDAADTVIEGFTFLDGCVKQDNNNENRCGAGVYARAGKSVYLVDCVFDNCSATYGGGLYGGTAIRCRFRNCQAGGHGAAASASYLFACVCEDCWHASGSVRGVIQNGCVALNCTIFKNRAPGIYHKSETDYDSTTKAFNCIFTQNKGYDVGTLSQTNDCVTAAEDVDCPDMVIGPARGDYSLMAGAVAVGRGKSAHTNELISLGVPADYLKYDFDGNEIDWSGETVNAGAVQTVKTPRTDVAKVVFAETAVVDGYAAWAGTWIYPDTYPVQYHVKPVVAAGKTFYHYAPTKGNHIYLQPNGEVRVTPPLASTTATQTYTQKTVAEAFWVEPSADGTDLDQGDGSEASPFKTLQAAMNAVTKGYTVIYAKPGEYRYGGAEMYDTMNRVVFNQSCYVTIRPAPGSEGEVVICGAAATTGEASPVAGCGTNAVRCVYGSQYGCLQGVTLTNGHTRADARTESPSGNDDAHTHGAAYYYGVSSVAFQVIDCAIKSCAGVKSVLHRGTYHRCFITDCEAPILVNRGLLLTSLVTDNRIGCYPNNGATLFQTTFSGNVMRKGESEFVAWYKADDAYNCVVVDPITAIRSKADGRELTAVGNWVWGNTGGTKDLTPYCTHADPELVNPEADDYRLANASPAIGHGMAPAQLWANFYMYAGSDLNYGPLLIAADGTLTPGCYQSDLPSVVDLPADKGLLYSDEAGQPVAGRLVIDKGAADVTLTVSGDGTLARWTPGYVANGVTNLFAAWPGSANVTFAYSATEARTLEALPQSTQWYVDAEHGDDGNKGFTPATAKKTLAEVFTNCAIRAGDTVNALPGAYAAGTMRPTKTAAVLARAVVPEDVNLRSTDGAEATFIVGATSPEPTDGYGCGTNAVRGLYLMDRATVDGFTITGGRALGTEGVADIDYYGGGVRGRDGFNNGGSDLAKVPIVSNCIISNNVAARAAGCCYARFIKCRIFENVATSDNMSGGGYGAYHQCVVDRNRGGSALMYPWLVNGCTLGPNNFAVDGERANDLYFFGAATSVKVWNSLVFKAGNDSDYYLNCAFADDQKGKLTANHIGEGSILTNSASLAVDAEGRPCFGNAVIDKGADSYRDVYFPETDCGGVPRILNGGRFDIGALEYDWRVDYGKLLGGRVTVTDVTSNVVAADDGVVVPEGALALDWASKGYPLTFKAQVTGGGTLTVTKDGEPFATLTETDEPQAFRVTEPSDVSAFAFAFSGDGSAKLSGFRREVGMLLLVR